MFDDQDRRNEFRFTKTHQRVLELDQENTIEAVGHIDDVDALDIFGKTPLHWAIELSDFAKVKRLLECGADPNSRATQSGFSALHCAARSQSLEQRLLDLLLSYGADPNALDCNLQPPLVWAIRQNMGTHSVRALLVAGADPNLQSDEVKWSPLHLAVFLGKHDCVEALLQSGADLSLETVLGANAVYLAARYGDAKMIETLTPFVVHLGSAMEDCRNLQVGDQQSFRADIACPVTDEWKAAWEVLINRSSTVLGDASSITVGDSEESEDDMDFHDALEVLG